MRRQSEPVLDALIIGAGISGLCMGIRLREAGIENFAVLEKTGEIGGTWRDNTYPGAACDIPAMFYQFSFEMKTDWSRKYPQQPEIYDYLNHCADKYGVRAKIHFNTEVESAAFDEDAGLWRVRTGDGRSFGARALVTATGQLHRPHWPDIPGRDTFAGTAFHSARWEHGHDFTGERTAVIGNGASAIQFIPEIARATRELTIFQRSANWMIERKDRPYSRLEKTVFSRLPLVARLLRWYLWVKFEARWPVFATGDGWIGRFFEWLALRGMRKRVADPTLQEALTPDYPVGCKRILISDDYYETLNRDDVEVVTRSISRITPTGLITEDGREFPVDSIVYATGFKSTQFLAPMRIRGAGGRDLNETWSGGAEAYLGVALPGFPNFFMLYGPNTNLGHNSIIFMVERQVDYVLACLRVIKRRHLKTLALREGAMRRWVAECQEGLSRTVWATSCESWYKTADGKITNNWPYSTITYWWRMREPHWPDFEATPMPAQSAGTDAAHAA